MKISWQEKALLYVKKPGQALRARRIDMRRIESAVMALGPNRNMTTLTASLIALHPNCQVLNNAGYRHMDRAEALLENPSDGEFEHFVRSAIYKSQGGRRGHYGGAITLSHAFDRPAIRDAYRARYGSAVLKDDVRCVYWKSAVQLTAMVRKKKIDLSDVVTRHNKVRFLMPIRNPLDCAMSNLRLGHYRHFPEVDGQPADKVVDFFIQLISDFLDNRKKHPNNFFCYFQSEFSRQTLVDLASFLRVPADETWITNCLQSRLKGKPYTYEPGLREAYEASIEQRLAAHPEEAAVLRAMATEA
jgi:hypothetical protein